ncbi:hypothetical protein [Clostridium sp.]
MYGEAGGSIGITKLQDTCKKTMRSLGGRVYTFFYEGDKNVRNKDIFVS